MPKHIWYNSLLAPLPNTREPSRTLKFPSSLRYFSHTPLDGAWETSWDGWNSCDLQRTYICQMIFTGDKWAFIHASSNKPLYSIYTPMWHYLHFHCLASVGYSDLSYFPLINDMCQVHNKAWVITFCEEKNFKHQLSNGFSYSMYCTLVLINSLVSIRHNTQFHGT